jgi:hypothetical protein
MILSLFKRLGGPRRNHANGLIPRRVRDREKTSSRQADNCPALLAIIFVIIELLYSERVFEDIARRLEPDAMFGVIRGSLGLIPIERVIANYIRLSRSCVKCRSAAAAVTRIATPTIRAPFVPAFRRLLV